MNILKQATAVDVLIGPFVDKTDGCTAEEGETPVVLLSKNGQALAGKNDATDPTHDDAGYYNCELDDTDTNTVGTLVLVVEASANALPIRHEFQIVEEAVYDALFAGSAAGYAAAGAAMTLADDAITAAKFDESTAYPLKSADTGATAVARTGADSDTLETLSDQIDTRSDGTGVTLHADYDAAKTASQFDASSDEVNVGAINGANVTESSAGNLAAAFSFFFDEGTPTKTAEDIGAVSLSEQDIADIGAAAASGLLSGGTFIKVDAAGRVYTKSFGRRLT